MIGIKGPISKQIGVPERKIRKLKMGQKLTKKN